MPYTDNKLKKFSELVQQAFREVSKEPNFEEDFRDADLYEWELVGNIQKNIDEVWKDVEVRINKYDLLEETLKKKETELQQEHPASKSSADSSSIDVKTGEQKEQGSNDRDLAIDSIKEDLQKLVQEIDSVLLQQIKERMRLAINSKIQPNFDTRLKIFEAPGLAEVIDPTQTIDTAAKTSLLYMLKTMPGGSIGIAGSRGAGKSTLIQMCCGAKRVINDIQGIKILPVLTSAPVQYESRDFILHLFSAVCQRVLNPNDTEENLPKPPETEGFSQPSLKNPAVKKFLAIAPKTLLSFGGLLIALSFLAAMTLSSLTNSSSNTQSIQSAPQSDNQTASPTTSPTTSPSPSAQPPSFIATTIKEMEIKPGMLLTWGIFLILSGFFITLFRHGFNEVIFFPQSYKEFAAASDEQRQEWLKTAERVRLPLDNRVELKKRLSEYKQKQEAEASLTSLQKKAQYWLNDIKFQQSFTSGWSGALKLPVGLEGGINRAVTLAQKQMSNPEIVAAFIKFIESVSKEYKVIIGIDELDKIESDEDAQKFLNEIKSIFGLPNCFYLISVSENAMSNFERRGLPFRDVFDSSFDNVVYVDYLNHRTAKNLLERRIIGKPYPFIYLSYCLSGGLPRDLIRNFRNLLEFNQKTANDGSTGKDITTLCQAIVSSDIKAKVRAIAASAKKIELEPEGSKFIEMLFKIESQPLSESYLLTAVKDLLHWRAVRKLQANATDEDKAEAVKCKRMEQLSNELGSYIYFLATVLQFFNKSLNETKLRKAAGDGALEILAKSRQLMAINPSITVSMLNNFRNKWEMPVPEMKNLSPV